MTERMMALCALLEKSSHTELLREMVGLTAHRLMELEAESLTGAPHGQCSEDRINQRNGYRNRIWETRAGTIEHCDLSFRSSVWPAADFQPIQSRVQLGRGSGRCGVAVARDLDVGEDVLRRWIKEAAADPAQPFRGQRQYRWALSREQRPPPSCRITSDAKVVRIQEDIQARI